MGERILREEGFEVVTVTDGETAIMRLKDVDPDVVIVDAFLPQVSGYDLCGFIKKQPQHSHVRVLLTSTALEKVDEDQAYNVGADGQLKKPFEASVMLKSLKDLIGGSDKKKRTGSTFDLSSPPEDVQPKPESAATEAPMEAAADAEEKAPVSALQAWLQQHDAASYNDSEEKPEEDVPEDAPNLVSASVPSSAASSAVADDSSMLSNPQLLRRSEEEPEDLSLRNNPVARLRYGAKPATPISPANRSRETEERSSESLESAKGGTRNLRVQSISASSQESSGRSVESAGDPSEGARPLRKSLLEQLEEFEKASEVIEEPAPETAKAASSTAPETEEVQEVAEVEAAPVAHAPEVESDAVRPDVASPAEEPTEESEEGELLLSVSRKSRLSRPSILDAVADLDSSSVPTPSEESPAAEEALPSVASAPAVAAAVADAAEEATVLGLQEAGVRLDEEEVRAVIEIAVSAAMPTIVDEVSRCVLLALESRYADRALRNGDHRHE
jgi:DNA-binding response OmpR family regulator